MPVPHRLVLDCVIFGLQRLGGISNYWAQIVDHATATAQLSTSLVVPRRLKYRDFNPTLLQRSSALRERVPTRVSRYWRSMVPDVKATFHTSYYRLPSKPVARYVVSAYDFTYERYRRGVPRFVHSAQKFASLRRADAVLCISHATKRDALEFCPGIDPTKLHVTHLGVDSTMFYPVPVARSDLEATVLFVGQRAGYKRFDLAVEAISQCQSLELGIVGPRLSGQEQELLRSKLGSCWREFGPVGTGELRNLYSSAYAFIFPSDYEGFGLPVLEAMACGCPVVAANASSLPEVGGGAAAYAAEQRPEAYASLLGALGDSETRSARVRAGIGRASEFSWETTFAQTLAVYLAAP